jgi:hypothetical protein
VLSDIWLRESIEPCSRPKDDEADTINAFERWFLVDDARPEAFKGIAAFRIKRAEGLFLPDDLMRNSTQSVSSPCHYIGNL